MKRDEARIQAEIVEYLSGQGIFCHSVPNEGAGKDKLRTMQMITMGLRPGTADLVVWLPWGEIGYLEVKTESGRLSERQKRFKRRCEDHGVFYAVVRSVGDVDVLIKAHIIRPDVGQEIKQIRNVCYYKVRSKQDGKKPKNLYGGVQEGSSYRGSERAENGE